MRPSHPGPAAPRARAARLLLSVLFALPAVGVLVAAAPAEAQAEPAPVGGTVAAAYTLGASDGSVYSFGSQYFGSMADTKLAQPVVGMAGTPSGLGYWMVASDGGIFSFGDAGFHGSTGDIALNKPIVGMAASPSGGGYWFVAEDGGIFSFGDADFQGSTGDITLNKPIVGMAATPTGDGYWLVAEDGGIFTFGDAVYYGSTGDKRLTKPIADMATTPDGGGYWLVAEDGGIFNFGNAGFNGSAAGRRLNGRVVDVLPQGGDITAPKLHWLSFEPSVVDTSAGPQTITVRARLTDELSGVSAPLTDPPGTASGGGVISFQSPSNGQNAAAYITTRVSGDTHDGVYEGTIVLPAYSEQGAWRITSVSIGDRARNYTYPAPATLAAAGYPTTFQQTGPGDTTPPALHSLSITPGVVDTSAGPQTITVQVRLTDEVAGVSAPFSDPPNSGGSGGGVISFQSPSGGQNGAAYITTRVSGDAHDGAYEATLTLPAYSEQGTWRITTVSIGDRARNYAYLYPAALAAAGYPTTFEVLRTG